MLPKFKLFPSPYSGILFLLADALGYDIVFKKFPSPYSGILFLSPYGNGVKLEAVGQGFRPLIRGFFFYGCNPPNIQREIRRRFRPLIRGFFFYIRTSHRISSGWRKCFRPLIRGFFFYDSQTVAKAISGLMFPSPYSGILFLSLSETS